MVSFTVKPGAYLAITGEDAEARRKVSGSESPSRFLSRIKATDRETSTTLGASGRTAARWRRPQIFRALGSSSAATTTSMPLVEPTASHLPNCFRFRDFACCLQQGGPPGGRRCWLGARLGQQLQGIGQPRRVLRALELSFKKFSLELWPISSPRVVSWELESWETWELAAPFERPRPSASSAARWTRPRWAWRRPSTAPSGCCRRRR